MVMMRMEMMMPYSRDAFCNVRHVLVLGDVYGSRGNCVQLHVFRPR